MHSSTRFTYRLRALLLTVFVCFAARDSVHGQTNTFDAASGANIYFGGFGAFNWVPSWSGFLPTAGTQLFASANGNPFPYPNIGMTKNLGGTIANMTYTVSLNTGYYYATPIVFTDYHQLYIGSGAGIMTWTSTPVPAVPDVWYTWTGTFTPAPADIGQPFTFYMNMDLLAMHSFVMDLNFNFVVLLKMEKLEVTRKGAHAMLEWKTEELPQGAKFTIERSEDGQLFHAVGEVMTGTDDQYSWLDMYAAQLPAQTLYYRIGAVNDNGEQRYSNVVELRIAENPAASFSVWQDQAGERWVLNFSEQMSSGEVQVLNTLGQVIWNGEVSEGMQRMEVLTAGWAKGVYFVMLTGENGTETVKVRL